MPYEIRDNCVYKVGDTKPLQCYDNKEDALAYLQALEANVSDAKKIPIKAVGATIKAIEGNRVGGYLVRFTSQDDPDLHGEYFDESTNFWLKEHPIKGKPILIDHAFDEKFKSIPVGILDFVKQDEIGIWVEGKLKERQDYEDMLRGWKENKFITDDELPDSSLPVLASNIEKAVKSFFGTGKAQWSSGALPQSVEVDETTRHIKSWAIIEGTAVFTPAEPNGTEISLKSLLSSIQTDTPPAHKEGLSLKDANGSTDNEERGGGSRKATNEDLMTDNKESNMDAMEILKQVMAMLQEYLGGMESPLEEGEAERMTGEIEEEMKQELPQEEEAAKMDEEELTKRLASKALAKVDAHLAKRKKVSSTAKSIFDRAKETQLPSPEKYLGGASGGQSRPAQISVSETLKYAHLSAEDMAMAWKMSVAAAGNLGARGLKGRSATDFVSEDFYRTAMHKMYAQVGKQGLRRPHEDMEVKAHMPFKANELDATDITGQGLEWLGYAYDSQVWETARNNYVYQEMMNRGMMEKPVAQGERGAYVPIESDDLTVYGGVEGNSVDSTGRPETVYKIQPQTTTTQLVEPGTFRTATAYTFELGEDSFVDMAAEANRKIRIALTENIEKAFINADSDATANTNINKIDGTPTSTGLTKDYYLEFDGLRKSPLVTSTAYSRSGSTLSVSDYRATWALLGSAQAAHKENIFFLIDFDTFQASLDLLPILTKDVAGEQNSLFTGNFENLWGIPVLMSGFLNKSNTAGKISVTPGNNTKGQILAVYAPYWAFVFKRNISIEMQRSPQSESFEFYGSSRFALKRRSASASAITYNLTV